MMFHRPCQVIFGTVRAIIELIFLCRKKLMKRGGVCEIKLSLSSLMSPSKLPNTTPYCGQTEARLETQAEEKLRDPGSLSNNGILYVGRKIILVNPERLEKYKRYTEKLFFILGS